jgi:AcrR family transcriptional regulator
VSGLLPEPGGSHRDRLLAAMADCVRAGGLQRTTVADVVRRARTSGRTF